MSTSMLSLSVGLSAIGRTDGRTVCLCWSAKRAVCHDRLVRLAARGVWRKGARRGALRRAARRVVSKRHVIRQRD